MKLALRLGRTLEELCRTMSSAEFSLWVALYEESPWDDTRADLHAGIIASTIANYAGKVRKDGTAKPSDFMPFLPREEDEEPDPADHFSQYLP
jgi:hypothetical protein